MKTALVMIIKTLLGETKTLLLGEMTRLLISNTDGRPPVQEFAVDSRIRFMAYSAYCAARV